MYDNTKTVEAILKCVSTSDVPDLIKGITAIINYHNKEVIYEHFEDRDASFVIFLDDAEVRWLNGEAKEMLTINEQLPILTEEDEKYYTDLFTCTQEYVLEKDTEKATDEDTELEEREFFIFPNGDFHEAVYDVYPAGNWLLYDGNDTIDTLVEFMGKKNTLRFLNAIM